MSKEFEAEEDTKEDLAMLDKIFSSFDHDVGEKVLTTLILGGSKCRWPTKSKGMGSGKISALEVENCKRRGRSQNTKGSRK